MVLDEIESDIESIARDSTLYDEANLGRRVQASDYIEFDIIERIDRLLPTTKQLRELTILKKNAG
ncbi:MAG: hypothetical protein M1482_02995, partial [Chloroflexi bacterium]|nr:hypothetical protein [Chloroflexota bacterium]